MHKTQGIAAGLLIKKGAGMSCTSLLRHINKEFRDAVHKPSKAKRYGIAAGLLEKNKVQGNLEMSNLKVIRFGSKSFRILFHSSVNENKTVQSVVCI